jgi:uncharacterized protein YdaU (DUF1376 family)
VRYFKFYTDDFVAGTMSMTAAELGDYVRILCLIYDQDGKVPNDPYVLRHALKCRKAAEVAKRIRRLMDIGKLGVDSDGFLHNGRASKEIVKFTRAITTTSEQCSPTPKKPTNSTRARAHSRSQNSTSNEVEGVATRRDAPLRAAKSRKRVARGPPPKTLSESFYDDLERLQQLENDHGGETINGDVRHLETGDSAGEDAGADHAGEVAHAKPH